MPISKGTTEKLIEAIVSLGEAVGKLNEKLSPSVTLPTQKEEKAIDSPQTVENLYPMPSEFRDAVNQILNKEFGIAINPLSDSPAFQFSIIVPGKYSNLPAEHIKMYHADIRAKVIKYADGLQGVRAWCEMVYNNFNPTIQAQIVSDRMK